jgi:hypothetical protein
MNAPSHQLLAALLNAAAASAQVFLDKAVFADLTNVNNPETPCTQTARCIRFIRTKAAGATRLPQARRGERVQRLLYLNPTPDGTPILHHPAGTERGQW